MKKLGFIVRSDYILHCFKIEFFSANLRYLAKTPVSVVGSRTQLRLEILGVVKMEKIILNNSCKFQPIRGVSFLSLEFLGSKAQKCGSR